MGLLRLGGNVKMEGATQLLKAAIINATKQGKNATNKEEKSYWLGRVIALQDAIRVIKEGRF